ncbi:MAG: hypothetical protein ABIR17_03555 [Pseudolysinimonas sp.]|uniref:hypothetical protein n=1 Tax=Pseudolysinimonas sp. TaxID=2680009 RepID=UPI003266B418
MIGDVRFYAVMHNGFTREWPSGFRRRTSIDDTGVTRDEAWTSREQWEPSAFFFGAQFGDFSDQDVPYVEVGEAEADDIRSMLTTRPRGGPFTEAGQQWLTAHPEDRAAIYLGVSGPVFDSAGHRVTPTGDAT